MGTKFSAQPDGGRASFPQVVEDKKLSISDNWVGVCPCKEQWG